MLSLFYQGGPLIMGILTILFLLIIVMAAYYGLQIARGNIAYETTFRHALTHVKSLALFTLVFGIFGQLLGLYQAFSVISKMGGVSPALLAGGLKVSTIPTLYGMLIFLISYLLWMAMDYTVRTQTSTH